MATKGWEKATMPSKGARIGSGKVKGRSKYNAVKTVVDGITFDSKAEAARYVELRMCERAGEIRGLQLQPRFVLHAALTLSDISRERDPVKLGEYRGDFMFEERCAERGGPPALRRQWHRVVEDVKGFKTPLYRWKKKHVEAQYGIEIREIR